MLQRRAGGFMLLFKKWARRRIGRKEFPEPWLKIIERNVPFYRRLPAEDKKELLQHVLIFMHEKQFEGCGGLKITDEISVTIAAQACILLLHRKTDYYPGLYSILVYPEAYIADMTEHQPNGIVTQGRYVRLGESWHRGSVVLSWDDVICGAADIHDGNNVVFHEFAHQLEGSGAEGDNTPVFQNRSRYIAWARVLQKDFEKLCFEVSRRHKTFLDEYGATNIQEFFAVATEYFFEKPAELSKLHPELYQELKFFYQQDPAEL
jgi:Mlc titration factor MtfA (ptsG expression regulator)